MRFVNVAVILTLFPASVLAAPFSWDFAVNGDFNNGFKWNPIGVPGATDTAAFDELGIYTVTHDGDFTNQSMTVSTGLVTFVPDIGAGRTYTLTGDANIQGTTLTLGGFLLPMDLDVGNDLKIGSNGNLIIDDSSSVITQNLLLGSLAAGGDGGIVIASSSSLNVTGGGMVNLGANGFDGTITVNGSTLNIAGTLELATDSDPGTSGTLFVTNNATVTLSDVEIGGGSSTSSGAFTLSTGGSVDLSGAATLVLGGVTGQGNGTITLNDNSQMTTGTGLTTILDSGFLDLNDTATFTTNGHLLIDDGFLSGEAGTQLILGPGTTTTIQNTSFVTLPGGWAIEGSGGSRDVVINNFGTNVLLSGSELSLGNAGDSAATLTINIGNVQVGNVVIGPQGHLDLASGNLGINNGDLDVLGGQFTAASSYTFGGLTDVSVTGSGLISVAGTATVQKSLTVNGGSFIADDLSLTGGGTFTFTSGLVQLNNGVTIGNANAFGSNLTLTPNHQLKTAATTTIDPFSTLTLDGGLLETDTFVNNGAFDFQRGTLRITRAGGLTIGAGGALSANVALPTDAVVDVTNTATIASDGLLDLSGGKLMANQAQINGVVSGNGEIAAPVNLATTGEIRVGAAEQLRITGAASTNQGKVEVLGGEVEFTSNLSNTGTGLITGRDAIFRFQGGLDNTASVGISFGTSDVFGDVTNQASGIIAASGNSNVTFFDDVDNDGTIQVSTGSSAVYFGAVSGIGNFPGGGTNFFEGDLRPGASPAEIDFGGDVVFGAGATLEMELGGTTPGSEFDVLDVMGDVTLGGTLDVSLLNLFSLSAGQSFEIINVGGTLSGTFLGLAESSLVGNFGGTNLLITYFGGDGNDVTLLAALPGDFDLDGDVDGFDFLQWQRGGSPNPLSPVDLTVWEANYGNVPPLSAASAAVPEPSGLLLCAMASLIGLSLRRR